MRAIESLFSFAGCLPPLLWNFRTPFPAVDKSNAHVTVSFLMPYFPHLWWIPGMYHESDRKSSFLSQAVYHHYCGFPDAPFLLLIRAMLTSQFPFFMLYFLHLGWIPGKYHKSDRKSHSVLSSKGRPPTLPWRFRTTFPAGPPLSANDVSKLTSYS